MQLRLGEHNVLDFLQDDFHTSFAGFLQFLPPELQLAKSVVETNRCFFIHLGIAIGIHPFLLQAAFREIATAVTLEEGAPLSVRLRFELLTNSLPA
jgi:hypothetical protein